MKRYRKSIAVVVFVGGLIFFLSGFVNGYLFKRSVYQTYGGVVPIDIGYAYLNAYTGTGTLKNVRIVNPPGFLTKNALHIEKIKFFGGPMSMRGDTLVFERIEIHGIEAFIIQTSKGNNIAHIAMHGFNNRSTYYQKEVGLKKIEFHQLDIDPVDIYFGPKIGPNVYSMRLDSIALQKSIDEPVLYFRKLGVSLAMRYLSQIEKTVQRGETPLQEQGRETFVRYAEKARAYLEKYQ